MPELPEVETIRKDLLKVVKNKKIISVDIFKPKIIKQPSKQFITKISNNRILNINRRGKLLIFSLEKNFLIIHLKMTGQLIYEKCTQVIAGGHNYPPLNACLPNKFSHVIFHFSDKSRLYFNDQRQFGFIKIISQKELQDITNKYGPEPLESKFTFSKFNRSILQKKTSLKNTLLDQSFIAGIGNIYADEICFHAGIRPQTKIHNLTPKQIKNLFEQITTVLKKAITFRGTTFNNYVDSHGKKGNFSQLLFVYGRANKICHQCKKEIIKKIKINGRGTHFCPNCQK